MEWVETTGRTVEEAKNAALEMLGVDVDDAEFEIVEEPKPGLFGRTRGEARVRARVRPTQVRPKAERRDRSNREFAPLRERGAVEYSLSSNRGSPSAPSPGRRRVDDLTRIQAARPLRSSRAARAARSS